MKIMLIAGCSHTAGSEIDGTEDSYYNRANSYGNILAEKLGYTPINIASQGAANSSIARSILEWFASEYNSTTMDVFVLVGWTESARVEVPTDRPCMYDHYTKSMDWAPINNRYYTRVNQGWHGFTDEEKDLCKIWHRFIADNVTYLEILSANLVLQIQYFLTSKNIDYLMTNTMHMFGNSHQLRFYTELIDQSKYINMLDNDSSFYWSYKNQGYNNILAKYWHHSEEPHKLYSQILYDFITNKELQCLKK